MHSGSESSALYQLEIVARAYNPSTREMDVRESEFKVFLRYTRSLRSTWITWDPALNKQQQQKQKSSMLLYAEMD